ncbi:MAG: GMC family oxidoreductase [Mycobacterium sp.]
MNINQADVVVVGSGAAGATVAGEALRDGRSVILIEAGQDAGSGRPGRHLRNDAPSDDQLDDFAQIMGRGLVNHGGVKEQRGDVARFTTVHAVGGRMTLWFNNCPEPDVDERNSAIPSDAWPELLGRARKLLLVRDRLAPGSVREARLLDRMRAFLPPLPAGREAQPMPTAAVTENGQIRFAGSDDILLGDLDASPPTLHIRGGTIARRIVTRGGYVTGIEVQSAGGGPVEVVSGASYVIAGGTVGTPQLLFASGMDSPALGAYMMDHPMFATRVQLDPELLRGVDEDDPSFSVWVPYSRDRKWHTQFSRTPYLADTPGVPTRLTGDLIYFSGSTPRPENRLTFDPNRLDEFGLPVHESTFSPNESDWSIVSDMVAEHFQMCRAIGIDGEGWRPLLGPWGTSLHLMGTYRMGSADDGTSVADSDSRVWGFDNLYVGGNGLLSERNSCNPTLQTVALALRSADHILSRRSREQRVDAAVAAGSLH